MLSRGRTAKINVKVLVILLLVVVALGVSLFAARQIRRSILSKIDLRVGTAAFERKDWPVAAEHFQEYLGRNPDDVEIFKKYAEARLSIRPLEVASIGGAISAYRRVMQLSPLDEVAYEKLALLYPATGNFSDLAYIARRRAELVPDDRKAPLWLAEALIQQNKNDEARQTLEKFIEDLEALADKHTEYVRACALMSQIILADDSTQSQAKAIEWLNRGVDYAPESAEAWVSRARFYRTASDIAGTSEQDRLALARKDLEAADATGTDNPTIRYFLGVEWMAHGELERAAAELQTAEGLPDETLEEHFFDLSDWTVAKFLLASQLAMQRGDTARGVALADDVLRVLTEARHRIQVLPSAVQLYVAAGRVAEARSCLDEYLDAQYTSEAAAGSRLGVAYLRALVARAEDNSYMVIDVLQPAVVSDATRPELWRLLAEAYSRTDQPRRAISALIRYLRLRPRDPEMTLQLAKEYLKLRDWNRAFETARLAEPLDPADIVLRLLRIEASIYVAAEQRQVDTARLRDLSSELAALRVDHPDRVDIRILQAIIAVYLEQPEKTESELKLAIEECQEPLRAEMQLVRHYYRTKRMTEAISVCQAACERHPELAEPWLSLSGLYVASRDNGSARSCLRQGLDAVSGKWEKRSVTLRLALLEFTSGDRAGAIGLLSEVAAQDKREVHARTLLLSTREIQADGEAAAKLVGELREAEGESGLFWRLHQASLWLSSDDWRSRQQDITGLLQYCVDSDPEWSAPILLLADMYEKLSEPGRVEDVCRQALARNPSATDIADRLMSLLEKQGRFSDAEQILQQIEADTRVASAWHVQMALRAGDFSRAIDELRLRVSNDDRDADSRILLARLIYWQTRDADQALAYLKEAEAITSGSMALTAARAAILRAEGQTDEAQRILNDYVTSCGDFGAYMLRAAYLVDEGKLEQAENDYRKLTTFTENSVAGYLLLSHFYATNRNLDGAVAALEEGLNVHPGDLRIERALMRILFQRVEGQDRQRALEILGALEEQMPRDPELLKLRAVQLLQEATPQSLAAAREKLEYVVKAEPTAVDAHLVLIGIAMQEEAYEDARDFATRALGSNPNNLALLSARGKAELALENVPMATQLAHLVLQRDPKNVEARDLVLAAAYSSEDRALLEEARTLVESALATDPEDERLLLAHARILVALQQPEKAIPELEAYCQTEEGSTSILAVVTLADLYRLSGKLKAARLKLEQVEEMDPNSQAVIHARFLWLVAQEDYEELAEISSKYLSSKEQNPAMVVAAASVLAGLDSMKLKDEGLRLFEHAVALWPLSISARLGLASTLYQTGNAERAEKLYRELLEQYPDNVQVLNDLAWILQEHGHSYDAALELADKGLSIVPDHLHLLDTRGTILSNMPDRLADAKRDFERLVELSAPGTQRRARALLKLGRVCAKLGDLAEAKRQLQKALTIDEETDAFTADERSEIASIVQ